MSLFVCLVGFNWAYADPNVEQGGLKKCVFYLHREAFKIRLRLHLFNYLKVDLFVPLLLTVASIHTEGFFFSGHVIVILWVELFRGELS